MPWVARSGAQNEQETRLGFGGMERFFMLPTASATCSPPCRYGSPVALVAPLGGGAIVAFQALHLLEGDGGSLIGAQPLRGRSPWGWAG